MVINIYGSCEDKTLFWHWLMMKSYMQADNIFVIDDLNFSLGASKILGSHAHVDLWVDYFKHLLDDQKICDMDFKKRGIGEPMVSRMVDLLLIANHLWKCSHSSLMGWFWWGLIPSSYFSRIKGLRNDLLGVKNDSKKLGYIYVALHSTFIALIWKSNDP